MTTTNENKLRSVPLEPARHQDSFCKLFRSNGSVHHFSLTITRLGETTSPIGCISTQVYYVSIMHGHTNKVRVPTIPAETIGSNQDFVFGTIDHGDELIQRSAFTNTAVDLFIRSFTF